MTMLEALERTKKMRAEREQLEKAQQNAARRATSRGPAVARRMGTATDLPPAARIAVEQMSIDPAVYEKSRVLMSSEQGYAYSAVVDSYRILRTRLSSRAAGAENWSTFGMVSAGPGEGKSVTCLNLALAYAREKKRNVFLLDLDLRKPSICRYLGVTPKVNIGSVLMRKATPEAAFFGIGVDNLIVAGGLVSHENSSELLGGAGMTDLFDYIYTADPQALILVDLPPLLISADALVVAPRLSAVVLVVAEGLTRRDQLSRAVEVLSGSTIAGIVLNRSRESVEDYYS